MAPPPGNAPAFPPDYMLEQLEDAARGTLVLIREGTVPRLEGSALAARLITCQLRYHETGNPLFVWEARWHAREAREETPGWVEAYLDDAADRLLGIP